ncbi:hypothetical protein AGMMS49936_09410 [Endomicrobiia bacterium]|nr:hypothetical protein AGMMS49936_09410 [Endomicrobiia bacterium]
MKKKKAISVIVLFGLVLSSCKGCPDKEKDKNKQDTLKRTAPDNDNASANNNALVITTHAGAIARSYFTVALGALKHATGVITGTILANEAAFHDAKGSTNAIDRHTFGNTAEVSTADAVVTVALCVTAFAEHTVAEVVEKNDANCRCARSSAAVAAAADGATDTARMLSPFHNASVSAAAHAAALARDFYFADAAAAGARELVKKAKELEKIFEDWKKSKNL